jgi:hypothetical protein
LNTTALSSKSNTNAIKYIATVNGVRDITLLGSADHGYWSDRLAGEKLVSRNVNGRAEIWICAAQLKWMGIRFVELSVSIRVEGEGNDVYLIAAFNTSRMFAYCERTFFHTPYEHASVDIDSASLQSFRLKNGAAVAMSAIRAPAPTTISNDDSWEGRIYLPPKAHTGDQRLCFYARLSGRSDISSFDAASDMCRLKAAPDFPVVQQLIDSDFRGAEWRTRTSAVHARSKTYTEKS